MTVDYGQRFFQEVRRLTHVAINKMKLVSARGPVNGPNCEPTPPTKPQPSATPATKLASVSQNPVESLRERQEDIARRAEEKWKQNGRRQGLDVLYWLEAEADYNQQFDLDRKG